MSSCIGGSDSHSFCVHTSETMAPPRSSGCHPRVAVDIVVTVDGVAVRALVEEAAEATAATQESPTVPVVITWTRNSCLLLLSTVLQSTGTSDELYLIAKFCRRWTWVENGEKC